jgi:ribulose-5-phosphate 4-epimerase/fuculose-1-phosphate aldolase
MGTEYQGVKFQIVNLDSVKFRDTRIDKLIMLAKVFHEKGLAPPYEGGSYGNLSFRIHENDSPFFITASHTSLNSELNSDNFIQVNSCDLENNLVFTVGAGEPSSETLLHNAIYESRDDVNCILHGHCRQILLNSQKMNFPQTKNSASYGTINLVEEVLDIISDNNFVLMKDHGFLALGSTIEAAETIVMKMYDRCNQ